MKFIIVLFTLVAISATMPTSSVTVDDKEWEGFKKQHNKIYADSNEETRRRQIYLETKKSVAEHQKKYDAGEVSFTIGINHFADLTHEEYKQICCGVAVDTVSV